MTCTLDKVAYERDHAVLLASARQPKEYTMTDLFRSCNTPQETSPLFSQPSVSATIAYEKNAVSIHLCKTEYYEYRIIRQNEGKDVCVFEGKAEDVFYDRSVQKDKRYTYFITPYFTDDNGEKVYGKELQLPSVYTRSSQHPSRPPIADTHWWSQ